MSFEPFAPLKCVEGRSEQRSRRDSRAVDSPCRARGRCPAHRLEVRGPHLERRYSELTGEHRQANCGALSDLASHPSVEEREFRSSSKDTQIHISAYFDCRRRCCLSQTLVIRPPSTEVLLC